MSWKNLIGAAVLMVALIATAGATNQVFDNGEGNLGLKVDQAGSYQVKTTLYDSQGGVVEASVRAFDLKAGLNTIAYDVFGNGYKKIAAGTSTQKAEFVLIDANGQPISTTGKIPKISS
jgi:hypothetical protein